MKNIVISNAVWQVLRRLKKEMGHKQYSKVIEFLIRTSDLVDADELLGKHGKHP